MKNLTTNINIKDLLIFILINISIFVVAIFILSKFYFRINFRIKKITTSKKIDINTLTIKKNNITQLLIKKRIIYIL